MFLVRHSHCRPTVIVMAVHVMTFIYVQMAERS